MKEILRFICEFFDNIIIFIKNIIIEIKENPPFWLVFLLKKWIYLENKFFDFFGIDKYLFFYRCKCIFYSYYFLFRFYMYKYCINIYKTLKNIYKFFKNFFIK